jgi:hypothetical protein
VAYSKVSNALLIETVIGQLSRNNGALFSIEIPQESGSSGTFTNITVLATLEHIRRFFC